MDSFPKLSSLETPARLGSLDLLDSLDSFYSIGNNKKQRYTKNKDIPSQLTLAYYTYQALTEKNYPHYPFFTRQLDFSRLARQQKMDSLVVNHPATIQNYPFWSWELVLYIFSAALGPPIARHYSEKNCDCKSQLGEIDNAAQTFKVGPRKFTVRAESVAVPHRHDAR